MATTFFKPLSCFEPESFERFATVSQDGRLKIFDTRTGGVQQQLTEKEHLSAQYTAIAWGASTFQGVDQAERSKRAKKQLGGAVAIGTAKGSIVVWDLLRGEVHKVLGGKEGHSGKVNDLVFTEGATFLFSCSDDLQVIKWNIENGEIIAKFKADNQPISSLGLSADNATLATGSAMIKMWDLASSKSQKKFTGHASAVTCLNFSPNGKFLVSSSSSERFASVWNLKSSIEAAAVFTASSNPIYVEFSKPKNAKASLVLALLRAGSVGVWQFDHKADREDKATSQKPNTTIKVVRSSGAPASAQDKKKSKSKSKPGQVLFAQFTGEHEILIAYGTTTKPVFKRVNLLNEATGQFKSKITIVDDSELGGALIPTEAASAPKGVVRTSVIGPSQLESLARAGVATQASKKAEPASKQAEAKKPATPKQTLTLQEQLDRMQITATSVEDEQKEEDEEKMEEENAFEKEVKQMVSYWGGEKSLNKKKLKANQVAPKATSLASALGQAIHTKDRQLLERVLQIGQEQIIIGTVKRLQQVHVLPFLQLILERFRAKPNRSLALLVWIRAVLVEHVAYLSTVPSLLTALSELYSTVRSRLSNHKSYVKLVGRLELLDAQIQERNARAKAYKNVHVYREDHDNGQHADDDDDDEDDDGVSVMDAMDMGDEDEQDMLHGDEDDSDDEEIEDDGVNEDDDDDDDDEDDDEEVQDDDEDGGVRLQRKRRQARDEEDGSDDEAAEEDDGEGDAGEIEADDDDDDDEDDEEEEDDEEDN